MVRKHSGPFALVVFVIGCIAALDITVAARAALDDVTPPPVPDTLRVDAGHEAFSMAHAYGTQNYICLPSGAGMAWTLFGPQATLFDGADQVITHFLSGNPLENGTPRATWQHSRDTSAVWAVMIASSIDPAYVAPGAIPWFKLQRVGAQYGPDGGDRLTATTFVQRVNTAGGLPPAAGCALPGDAGRKALVPYEADYVFYREKNNE
jgi:hypothetical protein